MIHYLIIFFISMVPLVELRGAVPYALTLGLPVIPSYIICIIGNMLPVPVIFLLSVSVVGPMELLLLSSKDSVYSL